MRCTSPYIRATIAAAIALVCAIGTGCGSMHVNGALVHSSQDWPMAGRTAAGTYADTAQHFGIAPELLWEFDLDGGAGHGAAIVVDSVLVCGTLQGGISVINLVTGKEFGNKKLPAPVSGSPLSIGNEIYVCMEAGKETIVDYNLRGGEYIWKKNIGGIAASPIACQTTIVVGTLDGMLYALRASDGETLWKYACDGPVFSTACADDSLIYCADTKGSVAALRCASGALVWKRQLPGAVYGGLCVTRGTVYAGSRDHHLYALDARTGSIKWSYDCGDRIMAEASANDSLVIIGALNGTVTALTHDGVPRWQFMAKSAVNTPCIILHNILFVTSLDTYVYALDLTDGSVVWKHSIEARIKTIPIVWNGSVILIGDNKTVYRFGVRSIDNRAN